MVSTDWRTPFFFFGAGNIAGPSTNSRVVARQLKAVGLTAASRANCFLLVFLTRARAHPWVFLLHFYIFPHNGVTDCPLMYVERAFIYIVLHYFYMFSVFSFHPSMLLILPFRVYEKKAKENTFAREENFCTQEKKLGSSLPGNCHLQMKRLSSANETTVNCK